ncbi:MAG: FAD-dependent 5-carboxymethylaminomethyl-2-thiouridine(34) oxidoreductase MnmC [Verrucomicrobiota bacterium]
MWVRPAQLEFDSLGNPVFDRKTFHILKGALDLAALDSLWNAEGGSTVLQVGFGDGSLFLEMLTRIRRLAPNSGRLSFVAVESRPFRKEDLECLHRFLCEESPEWERDAAVFREQWPLLVPGLHCFEFAGGRVDLTLCFGGVAKVLSQIQAEVDVFFLGAATTIGVEVPTRDLARLASADAVLIWPDLADEHARLLQQAGFFSIQNESALSCAVASIWRFRGGKRRVRVSWEIRDRSSAIVVGAGLAGTAATASLAKRGIPVTLIERHHEVAQEASGNLAGVMSPMVSKDDGLAARLSRACFLALRCELGELAGRGNPPKWSGCGVVQFAKDAKEARLFEEIGGLNPFPAEFLRFMTPETVSRELGLNAPSNAWFFPQGGWVNPPSLCLSRLDRELPVTRCFERSVLEFRREGDTWIVLDQRGGVLAEAPVLVIANANDAKSFELTRHLHFKKVRGQVTHLPAALLPSFSQVICRDGYLTPGVDGVSCLGATFEFETDDEALSTGGHRENLARLPSFFPGEKGEWTVEGLAGRVGFRSLTADRMPVVGALPDLAKMDQSGRQDWVCADVPRLEGLYGLLGLGSRGLVWSGLMGEFLAALICGESWPIELDLGRAVDPARFLVRQKRASKA